MGSPCSPGTKPSALPSSHSQRLPHVSAVFSCCFFCYPHCYSSKVCSPWDICYLQALLSSSPPPRSASHLPPAGPFSILWDAQSQQSLCPAAVQLHRHPLPTLVCYACCLPSCLLGFQFLPSPFPSSSPYALSVSQCLLL